MPDLLARQAHLPSVGSTNDVVRAWLVDGEPEVCLATADEQTAGRGRAGRTWTAPPGRALLLSLGFRPTWLAPDRTWRLAAVVALAMAEAGEATTDLEPGAIGLKWPNDLVLRPAVTPLGTLAGAWRKLAGVLGETDGLGSDDPRAVVGIGLNAGWPAAEFPAELRATMTSLQEAAPGRPIDRAALLDAFLDRLTPAVEGLRRGTFDAAAWLGRQVTTGSAVVLVGHGRDGAETSVGRLEQAVGLDPETGALLIADPAGPGGIRPVLSGEIRHLRFPAPVGV